MATNKFILGILCLVILGQFTEPSSSILGQWRLAFGDERTVGNAMHFADATSALPFGEGWEGLLHIARSQIGIHESTGNNDGRQVEIYLRYTGNKRGEPWCASFVSWVFGKAGFSQPRTAWSPSLFPTNKLAARPSPGHVFGIYFANLKRIAHCGLVENRRGNWLMTIEGNTNTAGKREGDGVYRKLRHVKTIKAYANWLSDEKGGVK